MKINSEENYFLHLFSPLIYNFKFLERSPTQSCVPLVFSLYIGIFYVHCFACRTFILGQLFISYFIYPLIVLGYHESLFSIFFLCYIIFGNILLFKNFFLFSLMKHYFIIKFLYSSMKDILSLSDKLSLYIFL